MSESTYSVYLVQRHGEQGGKREVTSPVTGHDLDFYETGVWLDRDPGRNFFPYEQIRTIREHPEGHSPAEVESGSLSVEESGSQSAEGEQSSPDDSDASGSSPSEGDPGAEEEMLEE